jgi:hypothetical protein
VIKGLALSQGRDDDSDERNQKEPADALQRYLVASLPKSCRQALEKFGNGQFSHPDTG